MAYFPYRSTEGKFPTEKDVTPTDIEGYMKSFNPSKTVGKDKSEEIINNMKLR